MAKLIVKDRRLCIVNGRLVSDGDGAPCVCGGPIPAGDWCFVQIFRCSCWDVTQSRWFPAYRLYVDGEIKRVYRIDGECWYTGRSVVLTPNFGTPGYPFYITNDVPGIVTDWYDSCAEGGCTTNQCPCVGANRLWFSTGACGFPTVRVCARYVTLNFNWRNTIERTLFRPPCPNTRITSISSASGRIVYDIFANQVVSVSISNSASASGSAPNDTPQDPCRTRPVNYSFSRGIGPSDTFGIFNVPAWTIFEGVMNGSFSVRSNGFSAFGGAVPVLDPNRSPDHEDPGYQPEQGSGCLLTWDFFEDYGPTVGTVDLSHRINRTSFSENLSWRVEKFQPLSGSSIASGRRSYSLSFSATVPEIEVPTCPDAVLGRPCSGDATEVVGISVTQSMLNTSDFFGRAAVIDNRCYRLAPDIVPDEGVEVIKWTGNCSDPVCGDGPPLEYTVAVKCIDPNVEISVNLDDRPTPQHITVIYNGDRYAVSTKNTSTLPVSVQWSTDLCQNQFAIATKCRPFAQGPDTVVYAINPAVGAGNGAVRLVLTYPNPECPDRTCTAIIQYQPTTQITDGPATPGTAHLNGTACGLPEQITCQSCDGPVGPGRSTGDDMLDAMGFDPEEELRRIRSGGCCGQPGA
jgi:hypothetical protein